MTATACMQHSHSLPCGISQSLAEHCSLVQKANSKRLLVHQELEKTISASSWAGVQQAGA